MKVTYTIIETQDPCSIKDGYEVEAESLSQAKRIATKNRAFMDTMLKIECENGRLLCYKACDKQWKDAKR